MKRCELILLAFLVAGWSAISPFGNQIAGGGSAVAQEDSAALIEKPALRVAAKVYRTIHADVLAIDQPYVINRLGASQPAGMIFVLKSDLVPKKKDLPLRFDNFKLRDGKRPRPLVLRMNVGDLLEIHFENWLQSVKSDTTPTQKLAPLAPFGQLTRYVGIHVNGLELVPETVGGKEGIKSDGSWAGTNASGLLPPRSTATKDEETITYRLYASQTGTFLLTSGADTTVHQLNAGLFGAVNVQPQGAEWYRSQTTRCEMEAATLKVSDLRAAAAEAGRLPPPPRSSSQSKSCRKPINRRLPRTK